MTSPQSQKLEGRIALITGGSSGLGLATARAFVTEGATVVITGRRMSELEAAARELGERVDAIQGDISKAEDLDRVFEHIKARHGRLDILFANAGTGSFAPLGQITEAHYHSIFDVNVKGTLFTVQKALPLMGAGGAIVLNGSMVSIKGVPAFSIYAASKAALRSLVRSWAEELKALKIRINAVSPGTVVTPGYTTSLGMNAQQIKEFEAQAATSTPMGRAGTAEEIAKAVLFLASDDSSYVNAIELFVDGGAAQI